MIDQELSQFLAQALLLGRLGVDLPIEVFQVFVVIRFPEQPPALDAELQLLMRRVLPDTRWYRPRIFSRAAFGRKFQ